MSDLLKSYLTGLLRHALTGVSAWLVSKGIASPEQNELLIVGVAGLIASFLLQLWVKYKDRLNLLTAAASEPTTITDVKAQVAAGKAPPVATPNTTLPLLTP